MLLNEKSYLIPIIQTEVADKVGTSIQNDCRIQEFRLNTVNRDTVVRLERDKDAVHQGNGISCSVRYML